MRQSGGHDNTLALLHEDVGQVSLSDWQFRNLRLFDILVDRGHLDLDVVSRPVLEFLTARLINLRVGAAMDPQNAGHVRAQNVNVIHFGLAAQVPKAVMTVSLVAGFIHDLNKSLHEPLRIDVFAVRGARGQTISVMSSLAQIVGLNHLGDRTRRSLLAATCLPSCPLEPEVGTRIDHCIVHHGLGSSRFIRELVNGKNEWWGHEFVDPGSGERKLIHPEQPPLSLASIIHDLADSSQQMQGGVAWLMKYPAGYWRASGRSFADMLSGRDGDDSAGVPMSLQHQIQVETQTCREIIADGAQAGLLKKDQADALLVALDAAIFPSRRWIDDTEAALEDTSGRSVYHDIGRALGVSAVDAHQRMKTAQPGTSEADELEDAIWQSARRLDHARAMDLAAEIDA